MTALSAMTGVVPALGFDFRAARSQSTPQLAR
jgi:hypothetical protein